MSKESKDTKERHAPHDIATRVQALTLKVNGFSDKEILEQTGVASRTIRHIYSRARKRGFDPDASKKIELKHIEDGKRTGRPRKDANATPKKPDAQQPAQQQQEPPLEGQQPLPQSPLQQPDDQQQQQQQHPDQPQQQQNEQEGHEPQQGDGDVHMDEADIDVRLREGLGQELNHPEHSIPMDPAVVGESAARSEAISVYPPPPAPVP